MTTVAADNNYCFFIYKNMYIERYDHGRVKISACCLNKADQVSDTIDFLNDAYLSKQRSEISLGLKTQGCAACWIKESTGTFSYRNIVNQNAANFSGDPYKVELLGIDYNVSPICNAKCIMCSSLYSSSWAAEDKKFGLTTDPAREYRDIRHNQIHKDLDLTRLTRIYFNGGEPLLSDEPLQILEIINQQQNGLQKLDVSLNSNGSIFPDDRLLEMWAQCKSVTFNLSIDACGDAFEYIRYPLSWRAVEETVHRLIELDMPRMKLAVSATVGVYNFLELDDLIYWIHKINKLSPEKPIELTLQPTFGELGLHNTSDKIKDKIRAGLDSNDIDQRLASFLDSPRDTWAAEQGSWLIKLQELDRRRGLDWRKSLPRLAEFVQDIENKTSL